MLPLRYPIVWALLGWGLLIVVAVGSVMPGGVMPERAVDDKVVHAFSYFLLMIWFAGLYTRQRYAIIALMLLGFGAVLELVQARLPYRFFDPRDLLANAAGIVLGLSLSFTLLAGWCQRVEQVLGSHD